MAPNMFNVMSNVVCIHYSYSLCKNCHRIRFMFVTLATVLMYVCFLLYLVITIHKAKVAIYLDCNTVIPQLFC